jgi:hypothetical protein
MDVAQVFVTVGGAALVAGVLLFFFGPRTRRTAVPVEGRSSIADRRL